MYCFTATIRQAGNGSAGIGICTGIVQALVAQGVPVDQARRQFHIVGLDGVLCNDKYDDLPEEAAVFARDDTGGLSLEEVVDAVKPTVLIGATAVAGLFSKSIVESMMEGVDRPIIFPLSNPTSKAEITALDAYTVRRHVMPCQFRPMLTLNVRWWCSGPKVKPFWPADLLLSLSKSTALNTKRASATMCTFSPAWGRVPCSVNAKAFPTKWFLLLR